MLVGDGREGGGGGGGKSLSFDVALRAAVEKRIIVPNIAVVSFIVDCTAWSQFLCFVWGTRVKFGVIVFP